MSLQRLQKLLSAAGVASRRQAEEMIRQGRVTVNGEIASIGAQADPEHDEVVVDGSRVRSGSPTTYLLLNKPKGFLTTRSDPAGRPTVYDLVPERVRRRVRAVGRLDFQTEGLLILTDDGELANQIAHPRYGGTKTYAVKVRGFPSDQSIERLRKGIVIEGQRTLPARIRRRQGGGGREARTNSWWTVELKQGRTRQIREMFQRVGHPVQKLRRVAIGTLTDRDLALGRFRELDGRELEALRSGLRQSGAGGKKRKSSGWADAGGKKGRSGGRAAGRAPRDSKSGGRRRKPGK